jgi:hypothetical protein
MEQCQYQSHSIDQLSRQVKLSASEFGVFIFMAQHDVMRIL